MNSAPTPALPGLEARPDALAAAAELRAFMADPTAFPPGSTVHISMGRRRSVWLTTWTIGLSCSRSAQGKFWMHNLLPKWEYTTAELKTEMIPDLEHLGNTGEQPKKATR